MNRKQVAEYVYQYGQDLAGYDPRDITEAGTDEPSGDIRIRALSEQDWEILTGDSSYDTDHRGHWGSSGVSPNCSRKQALEIAADLISQARDSIAEASA